MLVKRGKIYYARFRFSGRETWISTQKTSEREAKRVYQKLETEFTQKRIARVLADAFIEQAKALASGIISADSARGMMARLDNMALEESLQIVKGFIPIPATTAADLWEKYISTSDAKNLKKSTMQTKTQRFGKFIEWAHDRDCRDVSESDCRKFLESLNCKGMTRNHYIGELSSVFKASPNVVNPWGAHLYESVTANHKKAFSIEQIRSIRDYCVSRDLKFWAFAVPFSYYAGGRRLAEVVFLNKASVHDDYIDLLPNKTARTEQRVSIKMTEDVKNLISGLVAGANGFYFPDIVERYDRNRAYVSKDFMDILKACGITDKGYGFHSLRHAFITQGIDAGIALENVQAAAGQNAVDLTMGTYYHGKKKTDLAALPRL